MTNVKIRIEVNPNAESENLGDIQNQVDGIPSSENVSNVSVKITGDGLFQEIPSKSGGINGLSLANNLVFDENGLLDNSNLQGAVLESTESPVEFIWGVVPDNGEYKVRLVFTDAKSLKDVIIYGDSVVNQFPTQATIDGKTVIYNDDLEWAINLGEEADTHIIEFTHWNKTNYNACISKIAVMLKYLEIDKNNGLKEIESTSQSSSDTTGIYYGSIENFGSIEIVDKYGEIVEMIRDGVIDNSNTNLEVMANNQIIQSHITTDSSYDNNTKILSLDLGNRINSLDILKYKGYDYPNHSENLATLLFDVLSNLKYVLGTNELTEEEFKNILSEKYDSTQTLYDFLKSVVVDYPIIESNRTYREVIDEFCLIAQMQMYIDDSGLIKFVSARPKVFDIENKPIHIPKGNMFSQLNYNLILKNKYDGVEIDKTQVSDITDFSSPIYSSSQITEFDGLIPHPGASSLSELNENLDRKIVDNLYYVHIKNYYYKDVIKIPKTRNNNLEQITAINSSLVNYNSDGTITPKYSLKFTKYEATPNSSLAFYVYDSNYKIISIGGELGSTGEVGYDENLTESLTSRIEATTYIDSINKKVSVPRGDYSEKITISETKNDYIVNVEILVGQKLSTAYIGAGTGASSPIYQKVCIPESLEFTIYGNKRTITFDTVNSSTDNIEFAKTKISLSSGNLLQNEANVNKIKENILNDYKNGISSGNVKVSCNNYYNINNQKVIDWSKGEVLKVNQIVYFDNDFYVDKSQRYWKIKGRTFSKTGVPMLDLDLEETKIKPLSDYSWSEINEISKSGYASSEFSIGEKKNITLSDGKEITAVIIGFNHDTIASDNSKAGITFAIVDLNERSAMGTSSDSTTSWEDSIMRKDFLPNIYTNMPLDLQSSIKGANKVSLNGDSGQITDDKLWLFSISELTGGDSNFGNKYDEGKQYKYFARTLQDLIYPKSVDWWLRSCFIHNNYKYNAYIQTSLNGFTVNGTGGSNAKNYVMFGFCI